jgi:hypothetical protein
MAENNLAIWERLGKTDPAHTKKFKRGGGFSGTAIKPIYTTQKMTEEFGPAGKGWGMGEPSFQIVPGSEGQVAVFCTVSLWYVHGDAGEIGTVYGVGGDMVVIKQSAGLRTDDEAFKKAFTDAIGNAMKHLGMSADVHMGLFDDNKYVSHIAAEFADDERGAPRQIEADAPKPLSKGKARDVDGQMRDEIDACQTVEELKVLWHSKPFQTDFQRHPKDWQDMLVEHFNAAIKNLREHPPQNGPMVPPDFSRMETQQ